MPWLDKQKTAEAVRDWRKRHPEKMREYTQKDWMIRSRKWLVEAWRYGVSGTSLEQLLIDQRGCCAICLQPTQRLSVDHNHSTLKVRGLLCYTCNSGLTHLEKPGWLTAAQEYLHAHHS